MKNKMCTLFFLLTFPVLSFGQQQAETANGKMFLYTADSTTLAHKATSLSKLEIPKTSFKDNTISHTGFSLLYNETHEQAAWVAYQLTKAETNKLFERTNTFIPDPKVKTGTATEKDYKGSGYDRGHLAPASDMGWSARAMAQSFYYSNMSPQTPSFNRGIWKQLEKLVRTWAIQYHAVYVVTGPVLTNGLKTIGPNKVSVPNYYYKVVLDYNDPNPKGIGFVLPNLGSKAQLQHYAVSIDSVEKLTGIDFFPSLPNPHEALIEKTICMKCWSWSAPKIKSEKKEPKASKATPCKGTTKALKRCKNKTLNLSSYCYLHETQINSDISKENKTEIIKHAIAPINTTLTAVQCTGTTKAGNRCKRTTTSSSGRCYQH